MTLLVVGLSHRTAPIALLEQVAMDDAAASEAAGALLGTDHVEEVLVLATCNRLEVYAEVSTFHGGVADIGARLAERAGLPLSRLTEHLYVHFGDRAVAHLFSVVAGLDSMAVGESQVLGQVRTALRRAQTERTVGRLLHPLVQQALRVGKRAHTETTIDAAGPSLVAAGLAHVGPVVGPIERAHVLVVGAGTMSSLAATTVRRLGAASITVANRTPARARRLAGSVDGAWTTLDGDALRAALAAADVVVTCTGAVGHVVDPGVVAAARTVRDGRPQLFVDLALPRDVDPAVAALEGVTVLDLEALGSALAGAEAVEGVEQATEIVTQEVEAWMAGRRAAAVAPTVAALRARAREVVAGEVTRMRARLGDGLDEVVQAELEHTVHRVVEKLLHTPTVRVKSLAAAAPEGGSYAAALRELFDLDLDDVASVSSVMGELPVVHGEAPVPPQEPAGGLRGKRAVPVTGVAGEVGR